jgi:IstB-like ATP binding protein
VGQPAGRRPRRWAAAAELVRLGRYPLLVIDEVGYIPFEPEAANLFFQLVSARDERRGNGGCRRNGRGRCWDSHVRAVDEISTHVDVPASPFGARSRACFKSCRVGEMLPAWDVET